MGYILRRKFLPITGKGLVYRDHLALGLQKD